MVHHHHQKLPAPKPRGWGLGVYARPGPKESLKMNHYLGIFFVSLFLIQVILSSFLLPAVINRFELD